MVEDHPTTRDSLVLILEAKGFQVDTASDGHEALTYLEENEPPPVILLDMMLPIVDGWAFLRKLPSLKLQPAPKVVVTTGNQAIGPEWANDHGCSGFLSKPLDEYDLFRTLSRCLSA